MCLKFFVCCFCWISFFVASTDFNVFFPNLLAMIIAFCCLFMIGYFAHSYY